VLQRLNNGILGIELLSQVEKLITNCVRWPETRLQFYQADDAMNTQNVDRSNDYFKTDEKSCESKKIDKKTASRC